MKAVYKPIGTIAGLLSSLLARKLFELLWAQIDDEKPPKGNVRDVPLAKVMAAAALQGVTFKVTRAAVDRAGARSFEHLTGVWPGREKPEPAE
jgi:Protein of unknown function (DUF4235)